MLSARSFFVELVFNGFATLHQQYVVVIKMTSAKILLIMEVEEFQSFCRLHMFLHVFLMLFISGIDSFFEAQ